MNLENSQATKKFRMTGAITIATTLKPLNKPANQWRLKDILIARKQKLMWACNCMPVAQANTAYHLLNHYNFKLPIDSIRDEMAMWAQQDNNFLRPGLHNITAKYGKTYDQLITNALSLMPLQQMWPSSFSAAWEEKPLASSAVCKRVGWPTTPIIGMSWMQSWCGWDMVTLEHVSPWCINCTKKILGPIPCHSLTQDSQHSPSHTCNNSHRTHSSSSPCTLPCQIHK